MLRQVDLSLTLDDSYWSERYYFDAAHATPEGTMDDLVEERAKLAAEPTRLLQGRAQDIGDPTSVVVKEYKWNLAFKVATQHFPFRVPPHPADIAGVVATIGWRAGGRGRRMMHLGGVPNQALFPGRTLRRSPIHPDFIKLLDVFRDALTSGHFKLQLRVLQQPPDVAYAAVEAIDVDPLGLYRLQTDGFPTLPGEHVIVNGSRGQNLGRLRGTRRVTTVYDGNTFALDRGPLPESGPIRYTGGATVTAVGYEFLPARWHPQERGFLLGRALFGLVGPWRRVTHGYGITTMRRHGQPAERRGRRRNSV